MMLYLYIHNFKTIPQKNGDIFLYYQISPPVARYIFLFYQNIPFNSTGYVDSP